MHTDIECMVSKQKGSKYIVLINEQEYTVKNGTGMTFGYGDKVLVHCINGDFKNKVIIAKL